MARKTAKLKTISINSVTDLSAAIERYCRGLDSWPRSWMGDEKDLPPGDALVNCFRPFLQHLVSSTLSPKTIQMHVHNLWILGGEIIRDLYLTPSLRKVPIEKLLANLVNDGGPLLYHGDSEEQQQSFEATCNRFRRFLSNEKAPNDRQPPTNSPDEAET